MILAQEGFWIEKEDSAGKFGLNHFESHNLTEIFL